MLDAKSNELKNESEPNEEIAKEKAAQRIQYGTVISELAHTIQVKYIDNESYWA